MEDLITGGFLFIQPLYDLAFNLLIVFYRLFGENLGVAIIMFTLALKFATLPFSIRQVNSAKKSREFQTKYKELQAKHKNSKDKEAMTKELTKLQSEYLPAQLGGCLPLILQLLFFFQVYYVIINSLRAGTEAFNSVRYSFVPAFSEGEVLDLGFFGINLGQSPATIGFDSIELVFPYVILVLLVGASQFISSRVMMGLSTLPGSDKEEKDKPEERLSKTKAKKAEKAERQSKKEIKGETKEKNKEDNKSESSKDKTKDVKEDLSFSDALQQSSQSMIYILPFMTMLISFSFPAGLSLYWTVTSGFAIIQQMIVHRKKVIEKIRTLSTRFTKLSIQKS